jgi:putative copper resistance protein D
VDEGPARVAHELNQSVQLLATRLWLGGLVPLAWLLQRGRAAHQDAGITLTRDAIRHFSQMGYVAVAFVALTGAINSLLLVGSFGAMFGTPYGRLLALKILLFLANGGRGASQSLTFRAAISRDSAALGALCCTVGLEQGFGLCILAVVSVLGTLPPAIHGGQ